MTGSLETTRRFFEGCSNRDYTERRLLLMGDMPEYKSKFVYSSEGSRLEIVLFKNTYKEIFEECYPVLTEFLENGQVISDEKVLVDVYLMTIGMMLTSHENHSVINIHDEIVTRILSADRPSRTCPDLILNPSTFLLKELYFIQTLLNSNINKINKSSSLWHIFKKLFIRVNEKSNFDQLSGRFFFHTALTSAKLHPSNYYAWNFVTFTTNVSKLQASCNFFIECIKDVEEFCKSNLKDVSSWACYTGIIEMNAAALRATSEEFNKYSTKTKLEFIYQKVAVTIPSPTQKLIELSKWLWDSKCISDVPYQAFGRLALYVVKGWQDRLIVRQLMEQVVVHCALMEEVWLRQKGVEVIVKNGYFKTNLEDLDEDMILKEHIQTYVNWKRLLNWHTEFIFDRYLRDTSDLEIMR